MSRQPDNVLWIPPEERIAAARLTAFQEKLRREEGLEFADYATLHEWSVTDRAAFWRHIWEFCGVVGDGPGEVVLEDPGPMPGARWFPDARLNFAENLLQGDGGDEVLVFRAEDGRREVWTRDRLRGEATRIAAGLLADGIGPGDRVAGLMPNIPETIAAMLGAAMLGAVWSSCSPDFGPQGVMDRLGQIEPRVLFASRGYLFGDAVFDNWETLAHLQANLTSLERIVQAAYPQSEVRPLPGATVWEDYGDPDAAVPFARLPFDHPLFIMFSSGTTGLPKCMIHSAGGTLLQHLKEHQLHCDLGPGDRLYYFTTCGWMMWNWLVSGLASGSSLVLYDGSPMHPPTGQWTMAAEEGITVFGTSARWLAACRKIGLEPAELGDLGALRAVLSTGSPLAPESFDYVYEHVKQDVQLSSISGGTDIISCFALGCPVLPVRRGELQCRGLGMKVEVFDPQGNPVIGTKGELVCTAAFPSMPIRFWNDPDGEKYGKAYFDRFDGIWCHGDFAEITAPGGMVIHGRSDTVLNPGGVRIGTAEIYRVVEGMDEIREALAVGQPRGDDVRVLLFVVLAEGVKIDRFLRRRIKDAIRREASPRHVPALVLAAPELPHTRSGKIMETAVSRIISGRGVDNIEAVANPDSLEHFRQMAAKLT
ncbi:acetoacetate--CoA ligase [bacterium CG_4_9_14_3_um_filter_65_15]|nr:MAG: acetoacetate--CoA ligase [bacterium CG_4_9_14_3_um_filter_65_15]